MKSKIFAIFILYFCASAFNSFAQKSKEKPNAEIQKMLKDISAKRIEVDINKIIRRAESARRAIGFSPNFKKSRRIAAVV